MIELYRECHITVENGFHLEHRTIRHAPPDMTATLQKLREVMKKTRPHEYTPSRKAKHCVVDQIAVAMHLLMTKRETPSVDDEELAGVEAEDLGAD